MGLAPLQYEKASKERGISGTTILIALGMFGLAILVAEFRPYGEQAIDLNSGRLKSETRFVGLVLVRREADTTFSKRARALGLVSGPTKWTTFCGGPSSFGSICNHYGPINQASTSCDQAVKLADKMPQQADKDRIISDVYAALKNNDPLEMRRIIFENQ